MGCTATKVEGGGGYNCFHPNKPVIKSKEEMKKHKEEFHDQYQTLMNRISDYQKGGGGGVLLHIFLEGGSGWVGS